MCGQNIGSESVLFGFLRCHPGDDLVKSLFWVELSNVSEKVVVGADVALAVSRVVDVCVGVHCGYSFMIVHWVGVVA